MEIGDPIRTFIVEPAEDPFRRPATTPEPQRRPAFPEPVKRPQRETTPEKVPVR
jgi:hypothetical protein